MVLHPDTQKRAQDEIDAVLHGVRLPVFDDQQRLPYVNAIVEEVIRWHPAASFGQQHLLANCHALMKTFVSFASYVDPR